MSDNSQQIEQLLRQHDHDRWTCTLFAPDSARPHILALLAFNHEIAKVREIATEAAVGHIRLAWWREAIDDLSHGIIRQHFAIEELAKIPNLDHAALQIMIDARGREFEDVINSTYADFINYCRDTSGILWGLCTAQVGGDRESAINIGTAWAMIGILRSVMFQARYRRMYLPLGLLAQHGIGKDRFFDVPTRVDLRPVVRQIADEAEQLIQSNLKDQSLFTDKLGHLGLMYFQKFRTAKYDLLYQRLQKPLFFKLLRLWFKALY